MSWEDTFRSWGKAPGTTEQTKCENAETAIRKAIAADSTLSNKNVTVSAQGSYCNRTNVRLDSDVDICVLSTDTFFYSLPAGMTQADFGIVAASYNYPEYKNDVEHALVSYLGEDAVKRGKKAFDVHENSYRVDADVVACFEYRRYNANGTYITGTSFIPDGGQLIINWPQQNYDNGVTKNSETGERFKAVVRILKHLRYKMSDEGYSEADAVCSFLIECLVWNVPNEGFNHDTYTADVRYALIHLYNKTSTDDACKEWGEINELKYLFRPAQPWTRQQANSFLLEAWRYLGLQ